MSESESKKCPKCGEAIPEEAPQGLCPKCLLQQASVPTETAASPHARTVPPQIDELARVFPQLQIIQLIGQGGMGFVYKARQPKLERLVALKILPQSLAADPAFADRFTREGRLLARLNHPNIVTVHDFGQANGFFYLLMEYVDGVNLRQAMQAGRFTPEQALAVVPKICDALQFAHNEGVLHRDIKPENILLDAKGRIKIADFGIAKILGETEGKAPLTRSGGTLGTPHYMAPEQIEKPASVDHRADIYSLGVVFYEMLTGELPLGRFQPPSKKVRVDVRLDDVVLHALEKEPERRYQQASEVRTAVTTISETPAQKPLAHPATVPTPNRDRFWRRFAIVGASVVLALIMIPVLAILLAIVVPAVSKARAQRSTPARTVPPLETVAPQPTKVPQPSSAIDGKMVLSKQEFTPFNPEPGEANWGFKVFVPPGHLATFLFVTWTNGVPTVDRGFSTYFKVGASGGIDVPFCSVTCYRVAESKEFLKWEEAQQRHAINAWKYPESAGISNAIRWNVNLGAGYTTSRWLPMPKYRALFPRLPQEVQEGEQLAFRLVEFDGLPRTGAVEGPDQNQSRRWSGVDLRIFLEPFEGPAIRMLPDEKDMSNYVAGRGLPWSEEETYRRITNSAVKQAGNEPQAQVRASIDDASATEVETNFFVGNSNFPKGDSIEIMAFERSNGTMRVRGNYKLASADAASLKLYITTRQQSNAHEDPRQGTKILKGSGSFDLFHPHVVPGWPHLNMYPTNGGGEAFAELYFGNKEEAQAEKGLVFRTNP